MEPGSVAESSTDSEMGMEGRKGMTAEEYNYLDQDFSDGYQ